VGRSDGPPATTQGAPARCLELAQVVDVLFARLRQETELLVDARMQRAQWEPSGDRERAVEDAAELTRRARALGQSVQVVIDDLKRLYQVAVRAAGTISLLEGYERRARP
jgi:hypothetical protein